MAICGDSLPPWCQQLVFSCKFLFPFDMRRRFFYCTAFGPDRALQHLLAAGEGHFGDALALAQSKVGCTVLCV